MAKLTINTGTNAGAGDGDSLYTAFNKVNENFTELYTQLGSTSSAAKKDIQGSVFADDSTLLVDGVNGTLNGSLTGNVTGDVTGNLTGDVTGNITSSGTSTFSGTINLTGATVSSDVNFGDNDLTDINNLTIGGSLLTETMSPLLATAGNGQNLTLAGGQSTAGDGGDAIINAGSGTGTNGDVQIGASNTANVIIGDGSNTVDYPSGTTVDFTGATVTGLSNSYIKAAGHVDVSAPITATADLNVASVTSSATGKYDITFTTPLPNANYVVVLSVQTNAGSDNYSVQFYNRSTTGFQVQKFLNGTLDGGASGNFSFVVMQF